MRNSKVERAPSATAAASAKETTKSASGPKWTPAKPPTTDTFQTSVLHLAETKRWEDLQRRLARHPHEARLRDDAQRTPLHYAAGYDAPMLLIDALLTAGAPSNARDRAGMTALHFACLYSHDAVAEALVARHGADALLAATAGRFKSRTALDLADASTPLRARLERHMGASLYELREMGGRGGGPARAGAVWSAGGA